MRFFKITILLLLMSLLFACTKDMEQLGVTDKGVPYENYLDTVRYDKSLFYKNIGQVVGADPSVITVGNEYYLYVTNADGVSDCSYIQGYKSTNLSDWEWLGQVFVPNRDAWAVNSLWAPEVISYNGKYYMYYSGYDVKKSHMGIGVAVSDSPAGPFKELTGTRADGSTFDHTVAPFDLTSLGLEKAIDPSVLVDDDGRIYLFVSQDQVKGKSSVYGMELEQDMITVKADTITGPLVEPSQAWENPYVERGKWNEAPFVLKHDGKYYLTYSANYFASSLYGIGVAVSDSPLGTYTKSETNPLINAKEDWAFISGPGHCSFFKSVDGSETFIAYHSHLDVETAGAVRKINFDRITFENGVMVANGPSSSPQLLPSGSSKYYNIAKEASVESNKGGNVAVLTDGLINYNYDRLDREYECDSKTKITFTFDKEVHIKAIMVYDSADYNLSGGSFSVDFSKDSVSDVWFNPAFKFIDKYDYEIKTPGTAGIIQFKDIKTSKVTLTFASGISLSEIVIVGGDE